MKLFEEVAAMPRKKSIVLPTPVQESANAPSQPMDTFTRAAMETISGLYLFGKVIDRTRRTIQSRNGNSMEIVTYTVQDLSSRRYFVDEYTPDQYREINEDLEIPVYVKAFKKNNGDIGYSFCVQHQFGPARGEHF